jgi:ATP-binding cassette, subfamily B, bacterial MsbA
VLGSKADLNPSLVTSLSPLPTPHPRGFRRFYRHLKPARWVFAGGLLAGALYATSSGAGLPVMLKMMMPIFFGKENEASPVVVTTAKRLFGDAYHEQLLLVACIGLPLVFVLRGVGAYLNRYWINKAGFMVLDGIRQEVFARLQDLPVAFYHKHKSGDLVARVLSDSEQLKNVVVNTSSDIIKQPLTLVSSVGYLVYLSITDRSALFALVAILSVPLCIFPIRIAAKQLIKRSRQLVAKNGDLNAMVTEAMQSPQEIQAYNLQASLRNRFALRIREVFGLSLKTIKYQAMVSPVIEVISACGFVAALYFGVRQGMGFPTFSAMAIALYMAYEPVKKLSGIHATIKVGSASLERLESILDAEDTVPQPSHPRALPAGPVELSFHQVGFAYLRDEAGNPGAAALADVQITVRPGETVALVGSSGAGKSTFISLIPRFYDPTAGRLTLGGIDLREIDKTALRERIALVPQMPVLFNITLAENIRIGRPNATDDQVKTAARNAHIADFIESLPEGYDTMVGERGTTLSGGQRQRVAIARAFLKDAPILILDEATSALDGESEAQIQQALETLVRGRMTFMIAHRFSSIRSATRILVFDAGKIVADGAHEGLYQTEPRYKQLFDHQNRTRDPSMTCKS